MMKMFDRNNMNTLSVCVRALSIASCLKHVCHLTASETFPVADVVPVG